LIYTASIFRGTLAKTNKDHFYTAGVDVMGVQVGPCTDVQAYLNNATVGCPCNGTWNQSAFTLNMTSPATRIINKTLCVEANGNSTCPENFFFNTNSRYGSYRVFNNSANTSRILEITRPSLNSTAGYQDNRTYANFTANFTCPATTQNNPPAAKSGIDRLVPSAFCVLTLMWVW